MTIDLSQIEWTNDVFMNQISQNEYIKLNRINEWFITKSGKECKIYCITIELVNLYADKRLKVGNIIGAKNGRFLINTTEKDLFGFKLNESNAKYCTLEID